MVELSKFIVICSLFTNSYVFKRQLMQSFSTSTVSAAPPLSVNINKSRANVHSYQAFSVLNHQKRIERRNLAQSCTSIGIHRNRVAIISPYQFQSDFIYKSLWFAERKGRKIGFEDWSWFVGGQGSSASIVPFAHFPGSSLPIVNQRLFIRWSIVEGTSSRASVLLRANEDTEEESCRC